MGAAGPALPALCRCLGWWIQTSLQHSSQNRCDLGVVLVGQAPHVLLQTLEQLQSPFFFPWSRADPAGSRAGASWGRCGDRAWGSCSPPASVALARRCAGDPNSQCDPQRDAKSGPPWAWCVRSNGFFGNAAAAGLGGICILPEPRWVGLCPQATVGLSRGVPTGPWQAGQGPRWVGGAQGPIAGHVPGHPSAWRGGAASRYPAPPPGTRYRPQMGAERAAAPGVTVGPPKPAPHIPLGP